MLYQFTVNSRKMIDLQRIIDENQDKEVLLVAIESCKHKLLLVSPKFLAHFYMRFSLGGEKLDPFWGHSSASTTSCGFCLSVPGDQSLGVWRARAITDVHKVVLELRAARAAVTTVRVHSL